jgi:hypothetical protein
MVTNLAAWHRRVELCIKIIKMYNVDQAVAIVIMFNTLNIEPIENMLSDNVIFLSDWVLSPIIGREAVLDFLENKLDTMFDCVQEGNCGYYARLIKIEVEYPNEYLVELAYYFDDEEGRILMQIQADQNGLINSIRFIDRVNDN